MGSIRGKKLTVAQMRAINRWDKSINVNEWLYLGEEHINDDGSKHAAKNSSKTVYLKIVNRTTGEIKRIMM